MFDCESGIADDCEEQGLFDGRRIDGLEVCWPCYRVLQQQRTPWTVVE